jgi:hypothetical protein
MEINILMAEMLLTHEVENISRVVRELQQKICKSSNHLSIDYTKKFMFRKKSNELIDINEEHVYASNDISFNIINFFDNCD